MKNGRIKVDLLYPLVLILFSVVASLTAQFILSVPRPVLAFEVIVVSSVLACRRLMNTYAFVFFNLMFLALLANQIVELVTISFGIGINDVLYFATAGLYGVPLSFRAIVISSLFLSPILLYLINKLPVWEVNLLTVGLLLSVPIAYDVIFSANRLLPKDVIEFPNLVGAPILNINSNNSDLEVSYWDPRPSSFLLVKKSLEQNKYTMSVVFESLGVPKSLYYSKQIRSILTKALPGYVLTDEFLEPSSGGTLSGELRVLCGIKTYGDMVLNPGLHAQVAERCVDREFRKSNSNSYSIAFHGNHGSVYNRRNIYPLVGFRKEVFANNLNKLAISDCNNFQYIACDEAVFERLIEESKYFDRFQKLHVHIMTINSHFPYSGSVLKNNDHSQIIQTYLGVIQTTARSIRGYLELCINCPDFIIISGDHPPPFSDDETRGKFVKDRVPVYIYKRLAVQAN